MADATGKTTTHRPTSIPDTGPDDWPQTMRELTIDRLPPSHAADVDDEDREPAEADAKSPNHQLDPAGRAARCPSRDSTPTAR